MKKPRISWLFMITFLVVSFTIGLFIGRNYGGAPMTVTVLEEMRLPPPSPMPASSDNPESDSNPLFPININTASASELEALPGIGPVLAERIVNYRAEHGNFSHTEELIIVPGIGESRLENILSLITVGGTP